MSTTRWRSLHGCLRLKSRSARRRSRRLSGRLRRARARRFMLTGCRTLAAAFTARAKPKAPVSITLTWKQVEQGVKIADFTIVNVPELLNKKGDAWADFRSE